MLRWTLLTTIGLVACSSPPAGGPPDLAIVDHGTGAEGPRPTEAASDRAAHGADVPCSPRPFAPSGPKSAWRHSATALLVVTQGAPNHRGQDVIVNPGAPQLLIGKFAYGAFDKDLKGEDVEVFVQDAPPCGEWRSLGVVATSEEGQYGTQYGVADDGGRVFFTIPPALARGLGRHPVRMLVKGDLSVAAFTLLVVPPATSSVVFDIDGTLTTDDFELVAQLFSNLLAGSYQPKLQPDSPAVAWAWAQKGYLPIYLTGRPDTLRAITQTWLVDQKLPPGAVHLTDTSAQALPTPTGVGAYKTDALSAWKASVSLHAAYGNATTDIQAYAAAAIPKARTYIVGPNAGKEGTVAIESYGKHLPTASASPAAAVAAPPAAVWW